MEHLTPPLVKGKENIQKYLPQRDPFVMLDTLWRNDDKITVTGLSVEASNILCENGRLTESAMLENMAQTAAVRVGYTCIEQGLEVPVGFITAIKDFKVYHYPVAGDTIRTESEHVNDVMNFCIVKGRIFSGEQLVAEAEVRVFINKQEESAQV